MLKITFINVGYGEAILLEVTGQKSKQVILIDGGSGEDEEYSGGAGRIRAKDYLARNGIGALDVAVVTHAHEDHVCGIEQFVNAGGKIKKLITTRVLPRSARELPVPQEADSGTRKFLAALNSYNRLLAALNAQGTGIVEIDGNAGAVNLADSLAAQIIAPSFERAERLVARYADLYDSARSQDFLQKASALADDLNGFSLALMLDYQGKKIFLPGDATPYSLADDAGFRNALASGGLKAPVIKLAHHGQIDGVTEEFVKAASPDIVVTCASSDRRYQSAHPDVYRRIETWLGKKPVFLFSDAVDIDANTASRAPHQATAITVADGKLTAGVID